MTKRIPLLALLLALVLALAACGGSGDSDGGAKSGDGSASSDDGGSSDGGGSADCGESGDGIVRSFCDGPASVSFTGAAKGTIDGGSCEEGMGYYSVNAGTVVGPDFTGTPPNYAGFNFPEDATEYAGNDASGSITFDGESYVIQEIAGSRNGDDITLSGSVLGSDEEMQVTIKC